MEAILIAIGAVAGLTPVSAVVVTLVIGTLLAFAAVLHGSVASGAPAMTVVYVAATTVAVPLDRAWTMLASWASRRNWRHGGTGHDRRLPRRQAPPP